MKKPFIVFLALALSLPAFAAGAGKVAFISVDDGATDWMEYYGEVPGTVDAMAARYPGRVLHRRLSGGYMELSDRLIQTALDLAKDRSVKAIVVYPACPGTSEAFGQARASRPDLFLVAVDPWEDPALIQSAADLSLGVDWLARGYTLPWAARELGAKTFVHLSFDRHMSYETLRLRRNIMELACRELGLEFVDLAAPDPTSDVGVPGAQQYVLEKVPLWIEQYGKDTAFFATNDALLEPLIGSLVREGGIFLEADWPSTAMGYPGALGLDLSRLADQYRGALAQEEKALVARGAAGRFGVWSYSFDKALVAGLTAFTLAVVDGAAKKDDGSALLAALSRETPGCGWNLSSWFDPLSGRTARNHLFLYMDTYVFGKGYLRTSAVPVDPAIFPKARALGLTGSVYAAPDATSGSTPAAARDKNGQ